MPAPDNQEDGNGADVWRRPPTADIESRECHSNQNTIQSVNNKTINQLIQ